MIEFVHYVYIKSIEHLKMQRLLQIEKEKRQDKNFDCHINSLFISFLITATAIFNFLLHLLLYFGDKDTQKNV